MSIDVLFVDDDIRAAETFSELVATKTHLKTRYTSSASEAIRLLREYPIKVVVLDQNMPEKSGTELFKELVQIDSNIKAIMLTGEATASETGESLKLGYKCYLEKGNVSRLPGEVLNLIAKYELGIVTASPNLPLKKIFSKRQGFFFGPKIDIYLLSIESIDDNYVSIDSWRTVLTINAGEKIRHKEVVETVSKFSFDKETEAMLKGTLELSEETVLDIRSTIESSVSEKFKLSSSTEEKKQREIEKEYSLPPENPDPLALGIKSRHYLIAPVYKKLRVFLEVRCPSAKLFQIFPIDVKRATNMVATKQIDFLSNGKKQELDTGNINA